MLRIRPMFRSLIAGMFLFASTAQAAAGSAFGINLGLGAPYSTQIGVNYQFSDQLAFSAGYGLLDYTSSGINLKLQMPEALVSFYPFSGTYFVAAGIGNENLKAVGYTSTVPKQEVSIAVEAMTTIVKTGWMWGIADQGFWFGVDLSYIMPMNAKTTIVAPGVPTSDPAYRDAEDAAKKFGETSYINLTFARLGWLF